MAQPLPPPVTVPAYAMATVPAYPVAEAGVGYGAPYGTASGYGYGYPIQQQPPPPQHYKPPPPPPQPSRPPHNHAAGPWTQYGRPPPPPPTFGSNPDIEAGSFGDTSQPTLFVQKIEAQIRSAFIRKVYAILAIQLIATFALTTYLTLDDAANAFVLTRPGLAYTAFALSFVTLLLLMCYRDSYPTNLGLLAIWTLVEAYTVSIVTCTYARAGEGEVVMQAVGITALLFIALSAFTFQSKWNFGFLGGILFAGIWILLIWGVINAIWGFEPGRVYSLIGAVIFSLYIIFDTWLLSEKLPPDAYILGAISLYLDILNLLLFLIQILAESRAREEQRRRG